VITPDDAEHPLGLVLDCKCALEIHPRQGT
jgi:hypothetical protein